jgi:hypothetical protein
MEYFEPLTDEELHNHLRLELPTTDARAGWRFQEDAILCALDYLIIKLPVRVRYMTTKYGASLGTHYSRNGWHRVTIAQNITKAGLASETLWHELVHCMQAERFAEKTGKSITDFHDNEYRLMNGEWGRTYQGNLLEKEANRIAAERNTNYLLCKGGK